MVNKSFFLIKCRKDLMIYRVLLNPKLYKLIENFSTVIAFTLYKIK